MPSSTCSRSPAALGVPLSLDDWDTLGRDVPTLVDLKPSGRFLMEDLYYAGGLPAVMRALGEHGLLHKDAPTVNGKTVWENVQGRAELEHRGHSAVRQPDRRRAAASPCSRGNLAPTGAVLKPSAASPAPDEASRPRRRVRNDRALQAAHRRSRISTSMRLACSCSRTAGPKGYPGMAEVGNMGLPPKVLQAGRHRHGAHLGCAHERHRVRHGGAARLAGGRRGRPAGARARRRHDRARRRGAAPAPRRRPTRNWPARRAAWQRRRRRPTSGYVRLYVEHVQQADTGRGLRFSRRAAAGLVGHPRISLATRSRHRAQVRSSGRHAVVTGGAQGFGRAITERFLQSGATRLDVGHGRRRTRQGRRASSPRWAPSRRCRSTCRTSRRWTRPRPSHHRRASAKIDILVGNAGIAGPNHTLWEYPVDEWRTRHRDQPVRSLLLRTARSCRT